MLVMIIWFWWTEKPRHWMPVMGTALVMAGAVGNTVDRIMQGAVVDMFDFRLINFPIFNVADIGITVGTMLFLVWLLFLSDHALVRELVATRKADKADATDLAEDSKDVPSDDDVDAVDADADTSDVAVDGDDGSDDDGSPEAEESSEQAESVEPPRPPKPAKPKLGLRKRFENLLNRLETDIDDDTGSDDLASTDNDDDTKE